MGLSLGKVIFSWERDVLFRMPRPLSVGVFGSENSQDAPDRSNRSHRDRTAPVNRSRKLTAYRSYSSPYFSVT